MGVVDRVKRWFKKEPEPVKSVPKTVEINYPEMQARIERINKTYKEIRTHQSARGRR
jgi:hypothetical protein